MDNNIITNPFVVAFVIVIVLNIMMLFFYQPKFGRKVFIRATFYMYIITTFMVYFHYRFMENYFQDKFKTGMNMSLLSKQGASEEIQPTIDILKTPENNYDDELI
jgi:hypothetical protein